MAKWAKVPDEVFCFSCEKRIESESGQFGPFCLGCFRKTKQRHSHQHRPTGPTISIVPIVCPHADDRRHRCRYCRASATYFNVIVFDKNLDPVEVTGPYSARAAERAVKRIRRRRDREK